MWADFDDLELVRLAYDYCLDDILEVEDRKLVNREQVERTLTRYEYDHCVA
jgi:hypothetical protein